MTAVAPPPAAIPTGRASNPSRPSSSASNKPTSRRNSDEPKIKIDPPEPPKKTEPEVKKEEVKTSPKSDAPPQPRAESLQRPPARPHAAVRSKFDLEPNPFDLSFSTSHHSSSSVSDRGGSPPRGTDATSIKHNALPPLSSLTSPAAADPSQFPWLAAQSLRTGPLSPAMLAGPQQANANQPNNQGRSLQNDNAPHQEGGFDTSAFRTGFTPGTGSGFTPGYSSLMGGNFASSLPMPSPNTAAFLNMVTNSTPLGEGANGPNAEGQASNRPESGAHDGQIHHPPSAIPPHMQQHHGLSHLQPQGDAPQDTITPGTLSALTGVFNDMNRGQPNGPPPPGHHPSFYPPPGMHPPHAVPLQHGPPHGDYAQQSANAASQAANGLFLLSQAHQELSKREDHHDPRGGPKKNGKAANGAGQKRKSDVGPNAAKAAPPNKKGKKSTPDKPKMESASPNFSSMADDDDDDDDKEGDPNKFETEEDKRKNFLERNRQAALKCRQRKKAWLGELQQKVEQLTVDNERLQMTIGGLHDEVGRLSSMLMQHRDCGLNVPAAYGRPIR